MDLAENIKIICIKRKISMTELAEKTGQSQPNLANKLKRNDFKNSELEKIAAALDSHLEIKFIDNATNQPII
ncbi:MAG: helix-turn-helix domain-containing protein [Treponema sp.]|nr:helix-turn-helix domain-containing protein [Treponema sp.]